MSRRATATVLAVLVLAILVVVPALAASPSPAEKPGNVAKAKPEASPVTLSGTVSAVAGSDGKTTYTLQSGGVTYNLEAGPSWYSPATNPLKGYVGKSVTITGERTAGSNDVDVKTVDGKALRGEGKPPWAGGWKRVGSSHPGWSQAKEDRAKAKFGDCFPPGKCKDKSAPAASGSPTH